MALTFVITANGPIINYLDINRCENVGAIIKDRVESPLYTFPDNSKQGLLTLQDIFQNVLRNLDDTTSFERLLLSFTAQLFFVTAVRGDRTNH